MVVLARRRRSRPEAATDPDAIWRGEVADADIVMTAAEHAALRADRARRARRRSLVEIFGEPVGSLSVSDSEFRHRRRGDGQRRAGPLEQQRTAGCREEIQVTVLAHPVAAVDMICERGLLGSIDRIRVDPTSERRADKQLTWDASIRTTPFTWRRARIRLYGSPSSNVTVLTLTPRRSRRFGVRAFLHVGLDSMFALRDAVERGLAHSGST